MTQLYRKRQTSQVRSGIFDAYDEKSKKGIPDWLAYELE